MKSRLVTSALAYNLDAHRANPMNLLAGSVGMLVNNFIFLAGFWGMLFAGKPTNEALLPYFIALYAVVTTAWGAVSFFFGGLRVLGTYVTEGTLEPMLATPRDPLLLVAISRSSAVAMGDFVTGLLGIALLAWRFDVGMAGASMFMAMISAVGVVSLFILAGSASLFIPRGSYVGNLVIEVTLSLSVYPTGKMFSGPERVVLFLTPAAVVAVLPLEAVEHPSMQTFGLAMTAAIFVFVGSVAIFRVGVRRYRSVSLIEARS